MIETKVSFRRQVGTMLCGAVFLAASTAGLAQGTSTAKPEGSMQMKDGMMKDGAMRDGMMKGGMMKESMMKGMKDMEGMKMSGDTDHDFAMMMKMHHQQALDMAQIEIEHGKSAEMKAMARKIIESQKKEIAQFDKYLQKK